MIFRDLTGKAKGILRIPSVPTSDRVRNGRGRKDPLRLSKGDRRIEDFRPPQEAAGRVNPFPLHPIAAHNDGIRLSPFRRLGNPGMAVEQERPPWKIWPLLLATGAPLLIMGIVITSAWNTAPRQLAAVQQGLSALSEEVRQAREEWQRGETKAAFTRLQNLSDATGAFARQLRMRLLLPMGPGSGTETELPAITLDFLTAATEATRNYREALGDIDSLLSSETPSIRERSRAFAKATEHLHQARTVLDRTNTKTLPAPAAQAVAELSRTLDEALTISDGIIADLPTILDALGAQYPRRYAILLQNADEMRPTGGFIGSVLFVGVDDGRITETEYRDVYELDWKLPYLPTPPPELEGVTDAYGLRDSNRFPDFPRSAREALSFLERQGVETVDGIVAINHRILSDLLRELGPLSDPSLPIALDADNAGQVLSLIVESKRDPMRPKSIIGRLLPAMIEHVSRRPAAALRVLRSHWQSGDIVAYSVHASSQTLLERMGLSGTTRTPTPDQDYLMLIASNVGGNKSDRYISEQVSHRTLAPATGPLTNELSITRQHAFDTQEEAAVRQLADRLGIRPVTDALIGIMGKGANRSIIRAYVPTGSRLTQVQGIPADVVTIGTDDGKTVFSFPLETFPGKITNVVLTYALPDPIGQDGEYTLLIDKQIGQRPLSYDKRLSFGVPVMLEGADAATQEHGALLTLDRSTVFEAQWKRP